MIKAAALSLALISCLSATAVRADNDVGPSFAIKDYRFSGNTLLPQAQVDVLMKAAAAGQEISVDLPAQTVSDGTHSFSFEIGEFRKHCMINGLDDIGLTLEKQEAITAHEQSLMNDKPWILKSA